MVLADPSVIILDCVLSVAGRVLNLNHSDTLKLVPRVQFPSRYCEPVVLPAVLTRLTAVEPIVPVTNAGEPVAAMVLFPMTSAYKPFSNGK